jgi:L-seryl-tRNA(Ser) seleniumtransferase
LKTKNEILKTIPSVDQILTLLQIQKLNNITSHKNIVSSIRETLENIRQEIMNLSEEEILTYDLSLAQLIRQIEKTIEKNTTMSLRPVINATGVVLHTNLGRSLLSEEVKEALWSVASEYSTLEIDVDTGERGSRYTHVEKLLCKLTKAESSLVVNNNAAAVTLVLTTLAKDKEVIVSRGELVEIGGSFRIPEVMEQSGAKLVEVGSTNKTHLKDYENAINDNTGALLKVHTSNYKILGFTKSVSTQEIVELARKHNLPSIEDVGSGVLIDLTQYGLSPEPTVQGVVAAGMDIVTFSGDKLLGGPQAGIIIGKKKYIDLIKRHPLNRALRIDKLTLAALEATLKIYEEEEDIINRIPTLRMLTVQKETLYKRAQELKDRLTSSLENFAQIKIEESQSQVGGGALPLEKLPTYVVSCYSENISTSQLEKELRYADKPIFARIFKDRVCFDMRTLTDKDIEDIDKSLKNILKNNGGY